MSLRSVMVTGACTPTGERLVRALLEDSRVEHVIAGSTLDSLAFPIRPSPRLTVVPLNMAKLREVRNTLWGPVVKRGVDVVVHTGMQTDARARGSRVHAQNVESLRTIIEHTGRHPTIKRLILHSDAAVYQVQRDLPALIEENHPLNMAGNAPQWVRDRVEADITACTHMGLSALEIVVLRTAEVLGPGTGSQLFDYLESPICLRPAGYDPMINVLTITDCVIAMQRAVHGQGQGTYNIPGADTLPLSSCIQRWGRIGVPVPSTWMTPFYRWRHILTGHDFRYGMNRRRFHYSGVLDGTRAREELGYVPCHPVDWPAPA